jgi:hypothetical protein
MGYERVSQESSQDASSSKGLDENILFLNQSRYVRFKSRVRKHWGVILHLTLLLVQLGLLSLWLINAISVSNSGKDTIPMQYGRNFDYMSLDHKYDHLWRGDGLDTGGFIVLKEHGGPYREKEHGVISMYVS